MQLGQKLDKIDALHAMLYLLYYAGGRIEGRTKLEKMLIWLKFKENLDISDFEIDTNYYGPLSSKFEMVLSRAIGYNLIKENLLPVDKAGTIFRHVYELTQNGKKRVRYLENLYHEDLRNTIQEVAKNFANEDETKIIIFLTSKN
jgi:hypothetical protein